MWNLEFDAAQNRLANDLKALALETMRPFAAEAEASGEIPPAVRSAVESFGLPGTDGFASGVADPVAFCLAAEALAWADPGIAYAWLASRQVAWIIAACGTDDQRQRWLPRFAADPFLPASLLMHEGRGIAPSEVETEIRRHGNHLVVNGYKSPVMYPYTAAVSVVIGRDEGGEITGLICDKPGAAVAIKADGGGRLAMNACPMAIEARIHDLEIPADGALRSEGLLRALTICRLAHASVCVGTAAAATRYAGDWAQKRVAFGKPIIAFQGVSFVLADLVMEADAVRLGIVDLAAADLDPAELEHRANAVVAEANQLIADAGREGVQIMGVAGVIHEHPQERMYRSAAVLASIDFDPLNCELILR